MSISARGDREHCIRITTARQKCQHFRIIEHVCARVDTTSCVATASGDARVALHRRLQRHARANSLDQSKMPMKCGFLQCPVRSQRNAKVLPRAMLVRAEDGRGRCVKHIERLVKKIVVKTLAKALRAAESDANRANRLEVIRRKEHQERTTEDR